MRRLVLLGLGFVMLTVPGMALAQGVVKLGIVAEITGGGAPVGAT